MVREQDGAQLGELGLWIFERGEQEGALVERKRD